MLCMFVFFSGVVAYHVSRFIAWKKTQTKLISFSSLFTFPWDPLWVSLGSDSENIKTRYIYIYNHGPQAMNGNIGIRGSDLGAF